MPAGEENDPNGVPFLVAPVQSEDPAKKEDKASATKGEDKEAQAKAELKAETDELVRFMFCTVVLDRLALS